MVSEMEAGAQSGKLDSPRAQETTSFRVFFQFFCYPSRPAVVSAGERLLAPLSPPGPPPARLPPHRPDTLTAFLFPPAPRPAVVRRGYIQCEEPIGKHKTQRTSPVCFSTHTSDLLFQT